MKNSALILVFLLSFTLTSSSSSDLYRSLVLDHFLLKSGRLDSLFREDLPAVKENSKRGAGACVQLRDLINTFVKSDDREDPIERKLLFLSPEETLKKMKILENYEAKERFYPQFPEPKSTHSSFSAAPSPVPSYNYNTQTSFNKITTNNIYHGSPTPSSLDRRSKSTPFSPLYTTTSPLSTTTPPNPMPIPPSAYQSFFAVTPQSFDIPKPTRAPAFSDVGSDFDEPIIPSLLDFRKTPHSSVESMFQTPPVANVVMKPFTFFNSPEHQQTSSSVELPPLQGQNTLPGGGSSLFPGSEGNFEHLNSGLTYERLNYQNIIEPLLEEVKQEQRQPKSLSFNQNSFQPTDPRQQQNFQTNFIPKNFPKNLIRINNQEQAVMEKTPDRRIELLAINPQSLFESINQPTPDRPVRQKLTDKSSRRQMPKSDALQILMKVAGDNWEHKLLTGKDNLSADSENSFICPGPEGHYPDPDSCHVYYQCAQGSAHKQTCQAGLSWNILTNQCDWDESVDCGLNSGYSSP